MSTARLIEILEKNRDLQRVDLPKVSNAREFWVEMAQRVYIDLPCLEDNLDGKIRDSMEQFADNDSLELLNKQGKLLKRFGKYFKGLNGFPLDDKYMGIIGDKLQFYVSQETRPFYVDIVDRIDWNDGMFGKSDSCWWGCYSDSRECFIEGGGWGIRFYDSMDDNQGIGRMWIMPKYNVLLCFNTYGVQRAQASKVLKAIFDKEGIELHYSKCKLYNSHNSDIPYINTDANSGSSGAFVLYDDESYLRDRYDIDCEYEQDNRRTCEHCNRRVDDDETNYVNDSIYCDRCVSNLFSYCDRCDEYVLQSEVHPIRGHRNFNYICDDCASYIGAVQCDDCERYCQDYVITGMGNTYCGYCADSHCFYCEHCEENIENEDSETHNRENHYPCEECSEVFESSDDLYDHNTECHPELIIELVSY